jgi:hypothetical protein
MKLVLIIILGSADQSARKRRHSRPLRPKQGAISFTGQGSSFTAFWKQFVLVFYVELT